MTVKIFKIRIHKCSQCPHCVPAFRDEMCCDLTFDDLEQSHFTDEVPDWCPLPNEDK